MGESASLATLLITCKDRPGLVAALAQLLAGHGANILDSEQHSDRERGQFFQRIVFDHSGLTTDRATLERAIGEVAARFSMSTQLHFRAQRDGVPFRKKVVIFVSKYDHCLYDLLLRHQAGEIDCAIQAIVSNHEDLRFVAEQFGLPYHVFRKTADTKAEVETREIELLETLQTDLIVMARYMQILSDRFVKRFPDRIINIHHSFLPAFIGGRPYHQAYARGVKLIGATAHYATPELDEGPIIEQDVVRSSHRDQVSDLIRKGRDLEKLVLARAVRAHLEDRVIALKNRTVVFDG